MVESSGTKEQGNSWNGNAHLLAFRRVACLGGTAHCGRLISFSKTEFDHGNCGAYEMTKKERVHPAVKILVIAFLITFFGGGLLIFVNNLIVRILPDVVTGIIGGIVLILFLVMLVVSKCVTGVRCVRKIAGGYTVGEQPSPEDKP